LIVAAALAAARSKWRVGGGEKRVRLAAVAKDPVVFVYRVWGGDVSSKGSGKWGASSTPENPIAMSNPRDRLGIPNGNTGEFLTAAIARTEPNMSRGALAYGTHAGGIPNSGLEQSGST